MEKSKRIENSPAVTTWITDIMTEGTGSETTRSMYIRVMHEFCNWFWTTQHYEGMPAKPDLQWIIDKTIKEFKVGQKSFGEIITKNFFQYLVTKKPNGKGYARTSATTFYGIIRSFFRANNIIFVGKTPSATVKTIYEIPSKPDLIKAYQYASLKKKLRMGVLNDTGMRPGDAVRLVFKDVKIDYKKRAVRAYIRKISEKEDLEFAVCLSRVTTELLWHILDERLAHGEVLREDSALLSEKHSGYPITVNQLYRDIKDVGQRVGIKLMPKIFRKRFRTYGSPIIGRDYIQKMAAWKIPGAGAHYVLPPREETERQYILLEPTLMLEETPTSSAIEVQRQTAKELLRAAGLDPDNLLREANLGKSVGEETKFLNKVLIQTLQRNSLIDPTKELAKALKDAIKYAKEED